MDKIKSAKNLQYNDRYSKNPIINNLIKAKLENQIGVVKDNFSQLLKRQSNNQHNSTTKTRQVLKKTRSYSINPKKIQDSLSYDPMQRLNKITEQFVTNRQYETFLHSQPDLLKMHNARQNYGGLSTKMSGADKLEYEKIKDYNILHEKVREKTLKDFPDEIWLPEKPQVLYMIEDKRESIKQKYQDDDNPKSVDRSFMIGKQQQKFSMNLTGRSKRSLSEYPMISPFNENMVNIEPVNYVPQRYHKDDYKNLEAWLDASIDQYAKKNEKEITTQLNCIYSVYVCAWKQLIRLSYIQSAERGLLTQKLFYSMLKLFGGMISSQQDLFRSWKRQSMSDNGNLMKMMEMRMNELNERYEKQCILIKDLQEKNHKLGLGFIAYEKVNKDLMDEVEKITSEKKKFESESGSIGRAFLRTLEILEEKKLIEIDFSRQQKKNMKNGRKGTIVNLYRTYYVLNKQNKPITLGRFKTSDQSSEPQNQLKQLKKNFKFFQKSAELADNPQQSQELKEYNKRYGHGIKQLNNELNRFWGKKENDLEIKGILSSTLFNLRTDDKATGTVQFQSDNFGCQFPQNGVNFVQNLLDQQKQQLNAKFEAEIAVLQNLLAQQKILLEKWKNSFNELQQKNKNLLQSYHKQIQNGKNIRTSMTQLKQQTEQLLKQKQQLLQQIENMNKTFQKKTHQIQTKNLQIQTIMKQKNQLKSVLTKQKDNNMMLVRSNLQMKQKAQKSEIKYGSLLKNVKNAAPWLQKFINYIEKCSKEEMQNEIIVDMKLLRQISGKIQEYFTDFVEKDSSPFMTNLL